MLFLTSVLFRLDFVKLFGGFFQVNLRYLDVVTDYSL